MAAADKMEVKNSYSLPSSEVNRYVTEPVITATPAALVGLENLHGEFHGDLMKSQCNGEDQEELIEEIQTDPFPDMGTYIVLAPAQAAAATSPSAAPTTTTSDQAPVTEPGTDDTRAGRPPLASAQEDAVPGPDIVDSAVTNADLEIATIEGTKVVNPARMAAASNAWDELLEQAEAKNFGKVADIIGQYPELSPRML
eukprot:5905660-Pyramimonas_sp.AAC.1